MDASLCHQKSARALCCSHPGLMPAVNFTALPVHPPWGRRDAASRRSQRRAAEVVSEEYGLLKRSCEETGWPGDHLLALAPCRLRAELCIPSAVWSVGSRAGEPRRAWADSRHPSCFVSLLFNSLLFKRLVVCFTQEPQQEAAALLQKAQLKVLQRKCPGRLLPSGDLREPVPRQVPGAPELCSQVLDSCKSLKFQGNHICLVGGSLAEAAS